MLYIWNGMLNIILVASCNMLAVCIHGAVSSKNVYEPMQNAFCRMQNAFTTINHVVKLGCQLKSNGRNLSKKHRANVIENLLLNSEMFRFVYSNHYKSENHKKK